MLMDFFKAKLNEHGLDFRPDLTDEQKMMLKAFFVQHADHVAPQDLLVEFVAEDNKRFDNDEPTLLITI